jgi:hypothetical protein
MPTARRAAVPTTGRVLASARALAPNSRTESRGADLSTPTRRPPLPLRSSRFSARASKSWKEHDGVRTMGGLSYHDVASLGARPTLLCLRRLSTALSSFRRSRTYMIKKATLERAHTCRPSIASAWAPSFHRLPLVLLAILGPSLASLSDDFGPALGTSPDPGLPGKRAPTLSFQL